jgi:hypothetical protein
MVVDVESSLGPLAELAVAAEDVEVLASAFSAAGAVTADVFARRRG